MEGAGEEGGGGEFTEMGIGAVTQVIFKCAYGPYCLLIVFILEIDCEKARLQMVTLPIILYFTICYLAFSEQIKKMLKRQCGPYAHLDIIHA